MSDWVWSNLVWEGQESNLNIYFLLWTWALLVELSAELSCLSRWQPFVTSGTEGSWPINVEVMEMSTNVQPHLINVCAKQETMPICNTACLASLKHDQTTGMILQDTVASKTLFANTKIQGRDGSGRTV